MDWAVISWNGKPHTHAHTHTHTNAHTIYICVCGYAVDMLLVF